MKLLTGKEEELLKLFWQYGKMQTKAIQETYDDPVPHINTISTIVRSLEDKGFVNHESKGRSFIYYATLSEAQYNRKFLKNVVSKYFQNSFKSAVSALVEEETISVDELKELITEIENQSSK